MITDNQLKQIQQMEEILNQTDSFIGEAEKLLLRWKELQPKVKQLENYYYSEQWQVDYEASNQGEIPPHIAHGVLSEDAIYNTLGNQYFIAVEYLKLITQIISKE